MKRFLVLVAMLALGAAALAGCGTQVTAADIVQHMRDTATTTDSAHVVVSLAGQVNGQAVNAALGGTQVKDMGGNITAEIWYQKPNLVRIQVLSASDAKLAGAILLHDGSFIWAYDPQQKMAYKLDTNGLRELAGKANVPADLQDLLANPNLQNAIDQVLALTDYTLGGSEKVGAYQTYRLDLQPKAGSPAAGVLAGAKGTLWVDQATWVPVKATVDAKQGNGHMELTTFDLNKPVPAGTFQFSLPNGGHVVDLSGMTPRAMTIAEARQTAKTAGYTLLEPSYVPAGSTLVSVMASRGVMGNGASVIMNYTGGTAAPTFWVSELNGTDRFGKAGQPEATNGQAITVRGVQGHYSTQTEKTGGTATSILWWKESGTNQTIAVGGQLSQDELLKIAAGLK